MAETKILIGQGTEIYIRLLENGVFAEPEEGIDNQTVTLGAAALAAATSITVDPTISGFVLPAGAWYGAEDPTTGDITPFQVTARASSGTSVTVAALIKAIADNSTFTTLQRFVGRQKASIDRQANIVNLVTFDTGGDQIGRATTRSGSISFDGVYSQLDPAYLTCEYAFKNGRYVWFYIKLPPEDVTYTTGKVYKGVGIIENMPIGIDAETTFEGNVSMQLYGALLEEQPVAA
jgi:hypothetical protein